VIYPLTTGKGEEHLKLRTLESVWIRGRLKMWGRWAAFSKVPDAAGMFNQLLEEPTITKKALKDAMKRMRTSGLSKETLLMFLEEFKDKRHSVACGSVRILKAAKWIRSFVRL